MVNGLKVKEVNFLINNAHHLISMHSSNLWHKAEDSERRRLLLIPEFGRDKRERFSREKFNRWEINRKTLNVVQYKLVKNESAMIQAEYHQGLLITDLASA